MSSLGCPSLNAHFWSLVYYKKKWLYLFCPLSCVCKRRGRWSPSGGCVRLGQPGPAPPGSGCPDGCVWCWGNFRKLPDLRKSCEKLIHKWWGQELIEVSLSPVILSWHNPKAWLLDLTMNMSCYLGLTQQLLCPCPYHGIAACHPHLQHWLRAHLSLGCSWPLLLPSFIS